MSRKVADAPLLNHVHFPTGVGGLYAALILADLGISFKVLEASGDTGGRLLTHYFEKDPGGTGMQYFVSSGTSRLSWAF